MSRGSRPAPINLTGDNETPIPRMLEQLHRSNQIIELGSDSDDPITSTQASSRSEPSYQTLSTSKEYLKKSNKLSKSTATPPVNVSLKPGARDANARISGASHSGKSTPGYLNNGQSERDRSFSRMNGGAPPSKETPSQKRKLNGDPHPGSSSSTKKPNSKRSRVEIDTLSQGDTIASSQSDALDTSTWGSSQQLRGLHDLLAVEPEKSRKRKRSERHSETVDPTQVTKHLERPSRQSHVIDLTFEDDSSIHHNAPIAARMTVAPKAPRERSSGTSAPKNLLHSPSLGGGEVAKSSEVAQPSVEQNHVGSPYYLTTAGATRDIGKKPNGKSLKSVRESIPLNTRAKDDKVTSGQAEKQNAAYSDHPRSTHDHAHASALTGSESGLQEKPKAGFIANKDKTVSVRKEPHSRSSNGNSHQAITSVNEEHLRNGKVGEKERFQLSLKDNQTPYRRASTSNAATKRPVSNEQVSDIARLRKDQNRKVNGVGGANNSTNEHQLSRERREKTESMMRKNQDKPPITKVAGHPNFPALHLLGKEVASSKLEALSNGAKTRLDEEAASISQGVQSHNRNDDEQLIAQQFANEEANIQNGNNENNSRKAFEINGEHGTMPDVENNQTGEAKQAERHTEANKDGAETKDGNRTTIFTDNTQGARLQPKIDTAPVPRMLTKADLEQRTQSKEHQIDAAEPGLVEPQQEPPEQDQSKQHQPKRGEPRSTQFSVTGTNSSRGPQRSKAEAAELDALIKDAFEPEFSTEKLIAQLFEPIFAATFGSALTGRAGPSRLSRTVTALSDDQLESISADDMRASLSLEPGALAETSGLDSGSHVVGETLDVPQIQRTESSLDTKTTSLSANGYLTLLEAQESLKKVLRDVQDDHESIAKRWLSRSRSFRRSEVESRHPRLESAFPNGMMGIKHKVSPFADMRPIHTTINAKEAAQNKKGIFYMCSESFKSSSNSTSKAYISAPITTWTDLSAEVPNYTHYASLNRNVLGNNTLQLQTWPYFGDGACDDDQVYARLEQKFDTVVKERPRKVFRAQQAMTFAPYLEDWFDSIGTSVKDVLSYLLEPDERAVNNASLGLVERDLFCAEDYDRETLRWTKVFATLPLCSPDALRKAAVACTAFWGATQFSLWHVVRKSPLAKLSDAVNEPVDHSYRGIACRICHIHDCPYHGENREQAGSPEPDYDEESDRRSIDTIDALETDHPPNNNIKKRVVVPPSVSKDPAQPVPSKLTSKAKDIGWWMEKIANEDKENASRSVTRMAAESNCRNVSIQLARPKRTLLGASRIHGFGLYAGEAIKKDDFVGEYIGEIIGEREMQRRDAIYALQNLSYVFSLNQEQSVDSQQLGNKTRFINASSDHKNMGAKIMFCNMTHRIGMYALRDIKIGEELLFDYGKNYPMHLLTAQASAIPKSQNTKLIEGFVEPDVDNSMYDSDPDEEPVVRPARRANNTKPAGKLVPVSIASRTGKQPPVRKSGNQGFIKGVIAHQAGTETSATPTSSSHGGARPGAGRPAGSGRRAKSGLSTATRDYDNEESDTTGDDDDETDDDDDDDEMMDAVNGAVPADPMDVDAEEQDDDDGEESEFVEESEDSGPEVPRRSGRRRTKTRAMDD
ncbi:hypothetical protein MBLNU459_g4103t2 [Dothideomycetes sp. NU459]